MLVEKLMTSRVATVGPEASLKRAAAIMARKRISGLPVVDGNGVVGVLSEADILYRETGGSDAAQFVRSMILPADQPDRKARATTVGEAMSSPAITVESGQTVAEAARIMVNEAVRRLPVVDAGGRVVGIVTVADFVRAFVRSDEELVEETREVLSSMLSLDPDDVCVLIEEGHAHLSGEVGNRVEADLAEILALRVPGVLSVRNQLTWGRVDDRVESQ